MERDAFFRGTAMRIKTVKQLLWSVNALLVIGMLAFVTTGFVLADARPDGPPRGDKVLGMTGSTTARPDLDLTENGLFDAFRFTHELPISGFPPAPPEPVDTGPIPDNIPPLKQNYDLVWVKTDPDRLAEYAHLVRKGQDKTIFVLVGGKVEGWKLLDVRADNVRGFADFERTDTGEKVTLEQKQDASKPLTGAAGGAPGVVGGSGSGLIKYEDYVPPSYEAGPEREPVETSPGYWQIPLEAQAWTAKHAEKIAEDVGVEPVVDPDTRKPIGILIKSLPKNSGLSKYGIEPGDILVSINGVPMSSRAEAMRWLKGDGKGQRRYVAVVLRKGREITITYDVPDK